MFGGTQTAVEEVDGGDEIDDGDHDPEGSVYIIGTASYVEFVSMRMVGNDQGSGREDVKPSEQEGENEVKSGCGASTAVRRGGRSRVLMAESKAVASYFPR